MGNRGGRPGKRCAAFDAETGTRCRNDGQPRSSITGDSDWSLPLCFQHKPRMDSQVMR